MNPEIDQVLKVLVAIVIIFFAVLFLIRLVIKFNGFSRELDYINQEIGRTTGGEQRYWKKKRRLWLSLLPFYRR